LKNRIRIVRQFGDIPEIECFPNELNQVFMNILVNAAQAIKGSGVIM
jgi:signal transduction histidine kinase